MAFNFAKKFCHHVLVKFFFFQNSCSVNHLWLAASDNGSLEISGIDLQSSSEKFWETPCKAPLALYLFSKVTHSWTGQMNVATEQILLDVQDKLFWGKSLNALYRFILASFNFKTKFSKTNLACILF